MLTNKAIHEEIEATKDIIAKAKDPVAGSMLKMLTLILKMIYSIRTNQVLIMKKQGIEPIKAQRSEEAKE